MIVHSYYPVGETRVQRQALALRDAGFGVHVVCLRDDNEPRFEVVEGVRVYRMPVRRHKGSSPVSQLFEYLAFFLVAFFHLTVMLPRYRYQTVQVHNLPDFLVFAALPAKIAGAAVILDLHDLMPELFAGRFETDLEDRRVKAMIIQERWAARFADHVVTVTHEWRQTLIDRGVPAEKVGVVMNLADGRLFKPRGRIEHDGIEVVYHGTFTHRYGVDVAVAAVDIVRRRRPDIHLSLLGAGETRDEIIQQVRRLDLGEVVDVSDGMLEASALPERIARADIGLVPNRSNIFTDGILPTKLLEYVAMGVPVIASATPGVMAYFDESMVRFATPGDPQELADAILELAADEADRDTQVEAANRFNERYNWEQAAAEYVAMVSRLAAPAADDPGSLR